MKRTAVYVLTLLFVLSICSAANAGTANDWRMLFRGSSTDYTFAASMMQLGTATGSIDGKDSRDFKYTSNTGNQAQVAAYVPWFPDNPPYYKSIMHSPLGSGYYCKSWDLLFWCGSAYTKDVARLSVWTVSSIAPPADLWGGYPFQMNVQIVNDPTNTYNAGKCWVIPGGVTGTSASPYLSIDFNNIQNTLRMADSVAATNGVKLRVTVGVIPEPSGIVTLSSAFIGFAAMLRRRVK